MTRPPAPRITADAGLITYGPPTSVIRWVAVEARTRTMWKRLSRKKPMIAARTAAGSPAAIARRNAGVAAACLRACCAGAPCASARIRLRPTRPNAAARVAAAVAPQAVGGRAGGRRLTVVRPPGNVVAGKDADPEPPKPTRAPVRPWVIASKDRSSPTDRT